MRTVDFECCILGAGPAGLAAGLELARHGVKEIAVIEKNKIVGGLARTETFDDYRFDVGPHRFFTKNKEIDTLWHETLGKDFIPLDRTTRIFYDNKFFSYPLNVGNVLLNLGFLESANCLISFASAKFDKHFLPISFEDWIVHRFGRKLYEIFFKTYTEKVWGIPCNQISAEWAAQRIKGLDIVKVIKNSFPFGNSQKIKTLVEQFDYPVLGAGQMYNVMADSLTESGTDFFLDHSVKKINTHESRIISIEVEEKSSGTVIEIRANQFFTSIPMTHFFKILSPLPSKEVLAAAASLYYRDHITVDIIVDKESLFPDQWIYVHSPEVKMARLANYNNFSKAMVKHRLKTAVSVEYFVFQSDDLWKMTDRQLIELASEEIHQMRLVDKKLIENSWVVRETESYPTYFLGYKDHYDLLKDEFNKIGNIFPIGRGGLYKYNNQDHSAFSGILAARNYLNLQGHQYDLWSINIDAEYQESAKRNEI